MRLTARESLKKGKGLFGFWFFDCGSWGLGAVEVTLGVDWSTVSEDLECLLGGGGE